MLKIPSLEKTLFLAIERQGQLTINEVIQICEEHGNYLETGGRKLRKYYRKNLPQDQRELLGYIEPLKDEKRHNKAWIYHYPRPIEKSIEELKVKQEKLI